MKLNKYTLGILSIIVIASLAVLLVIQFRIIERDIENNTQMMELAIPGILSNLYDNMMFNRELRKYSDDYRGTSDFSFTNDSIPEDPLQIVIKNELDAVLALNYPELDYKVDGFVSSEFGCMIHRNHRPELPKAKPIVKAKNHLCFCMILNNTVDISMAYTNKEEILLSDSLDMLRVSLVLILVIMAAFLYTFRTIRKQKKLSVLKRDFINNLTHEFKTPIFSISLAARSLKERNEIQNSEKMSSYVDLIGTEGKRLQNQVDKVLQAALLDSGNQNFEFNLIDVHSSIEKVVRNLGVVIAEKKGNTDLKFEAKYSIVEADEVHLSNVIYNLIDNALKYVEKVPQILISTVNDNDGNISISIEDNGIGMDKSTQKHVFEQFYRAKQGDLYNTKGFGLGLSYVKNIVLSHGGTIALRSKKGEGSKFVINLPVKK